MNKWIFLIYEMIVVFLSILLVKHELAPNGLDIEFLAAFVAFFTIRGFSIDERLREMRKVTYKNGEPSMETIPFESTRGVELLREYRAREAVRGI